MVITLRVLQVAVALSIIPMMCLGVMSGLSGGGLTPAFQRIGQLLLTLSPIVGVGGVAASILLWRWQLPVLAYAVIIIPLVMWVWLIVWLQSATGFFY